MRRSKTNESALLIFRRGVGRTCGLELVRRAGPRSSPTHGGAFTLLELLLVVSIIALLLSTSLPSLAAARRKARATVCLSNLHQLAVACDSYSVTDPKSLILPAHPISDIDELHHDGVFDWGGRTGRSRGWDGTYSSNGPRTAETRPLNRQPFGRVDNSTDFSLFRCPDDSGRKEQWSGETWAWTNDFYELSLYEAVGTSYRGNAVRDHGWGPDGAWATGPFRIIGVFLRPVSRVPVPAGTVLLAEGNATVYRGGIYPESY